jgi:hypothetical protein
MPRRPNADASMNRVPARVRAALAAAPGNAGPAGRRALATAARRIYISKEATMKCLQAIPLLLIAANALAAQGTWSGDLTTSACVGAHTSKFHTQATSAHDCAVDCVKEGAKYVFVSDGKVYQITNQKHAALRQRVGQTVRITGDMKGDRITVSRVGVQSGRS